MIRVLLAEDHNFVRAGLADLLGNVDDFELVGAAADGAEAVALAARARAAGGVDGPVDAGVDGIEATRRICEARPGVNVVVLTSFSDRERILDALDAGAIGYLLKDAEPDELFRGSAPRPAASRRWRRRRRARCCWPRERARPTAGSRERELDVLAWCRAASRTS